MAYDDKLKLSWETVEVAVQALYNKILQSEWKPGLIVGVTKGGTIPASLLHQKFPQAKFLSITASSYGEDNERRPRVDVDLHGITDTSINRPATLVVDDLWDTGHTMFTIQKRLDQVKTACVYIKPYKGDMPPVQPSYYGQLLPTNRWCVFPWEI